MKQLIKGATIIDSRSPHHGKKRDILLQKGIIQKIAASIKDEKAQVIKAPGLCVSPGWFDMMASFRDPGHEWKEDIHSGLEAASRGGFTGVLVMPDTEPPLSDKAGVEYALRKGADHHVEIQVAGRISREGKQLAELYDMHQAGASAFTDHKKPVNNTELMSRALEYSRNFNGLIVSFPWDDGVVAGGVMHEGPASVSLGLRGIPALSEELRLARDLDLLRYNGGRLHVGLISTAKSVSMIRAAKKEGLQVSCGISAHQLSFLDEDMADFETLRKVLPPFRSKADVSALKRGLADGTIDVICSDHSPQDIESKAVEFEHADWGFSALETAFAAIRTASEGKVELERIIDALTHGPRDILGLEQVSVQEGAPANLTLFQPDETHTVAGSEFASRSNLTPFEGMTLKGRVTGTIR